MQACVNLAGKILTPIRCCARAFARKLAAWPEAPKSLGFALCGLVSMGLVGCYHGIALYPEKIDRDYATLAIEMWGAFPRTFRPAQYMLDKDANPAFGENKYKNYVGSIPMMFAGFNGVNICDRTTDATCLGWAVGEEYLQHPQVDANVRRWLAHLCRNIVEDTNTDPSRFYLNEADRKESIRRLHRFFECEAKHQLQARVHIYVIRDFDRVFDGNESKSNSTLNAAVVRQEIIVVNE